MAIGTEIKMVYRALGVLNSPSDLCIAFAEFHENAGSWTFDLKASDTYSIPAVDKAITEFIDKNGLDYKVALITLHLENLNNEIYGALIAANTGLPVITDLAAIDNSLGGNGDFYQTCFQKLGIAEDETTRLNKAICIAFMGILRWREEYNFLSSVTGASRSSIGGAIWLGQEG